MGDFGISPEARKRTPELYLQSYLRVLGVGDKVVLKIEFTILSRPFPFNGVFTPLKPPRISMWIPVAPFPNEDKIALSILLHEVGHYNHSLKLRDLWTMATYAEREIEADRYGIPLARKLGVLGEYRLSSLAVLTWDPFNAPVEIQNIIDRMIESFK